MLEELVAWAGDCVIRGQVDLGEERLADRINHADSLVFFHAILRALEDGHEVRLEEVEIERGELLLLEVRGYRGDPSRRLRTVTDLVRLHVGPYVIVGQLHRPPAVYPLGPLMGLTRFVPLTDVELMIGGQPTGLELHDVVLVNRERIDRSEPLDRRYV